MYPRPLQTLMLITLMASIYSTHTGQGSPGKQEKNTQQLVSPSPIACQPNTLKDLVNNPLVPSQAYPAALQAYLKSLDHYPHRRSNQISSKQ